MSTYDYRSVLNNIYKGFKKESDGFTPSRGTPYQYFTA
jgi:hypothetical protein